MLTGRRVPQARDPVSGGSTGVLSLGAGPASVRTALTGGRGQPGRGAPGLQETGGSWFSDVGQKHHKLVLGAAGGLPDLSAGQRTASPHPPVES